MRQWPWITLAVAAVAVASPFGRDLIFLAFFSGEALSNNIMQPFAYMALAVLVLLGAAEWWIRRTFHKRRMKH